jgi:hypothetical protein
MKSTAVGAREPTILARQKFAENWRDIAIGIPRTHHRGGFIAPFTFRGLLDNGLLLEFTIKERPTTVI